MSITGGGRRDAPTTIAVMKSTNRAGCAASRDISEESGRVVRRRSCSMEVEIGSPELAGVAASGLDQARSNLAVELSFS